MSIKVRKHYTAEFKAQAVKLVRAGRATQTVATELEVELSCLYTWVRSANAGLTQAQGASWPACRWKLVQKQRYKDAGEARLNLFEYIEAYYNTQRKHSSIGYLSPSQFER